jgi:ankyrin repeat protein
VKIALEAIKVAPDRDRNGRREPGCARAGASSAAAVETNCRLSAGARLTKRRHVDVVSLLLDRGANIDQILPGRQNALIRASEKGRLEVVKLLVARGADVNARAWYPRTRTIVVKNAKGETKKYTIDAEGVERVKKDGTREIVKEIVKKDGTREIVDDTIKKGEWRTPLSMAERGGHKDVVAFLLASGARE